MELTRFSHSLRSDGTECIFVRTDCTYTNHFLGSTDFAPLYCYRFGYGNHALRTERRRGGFQTEVVSKHHFALQELMEIKYKKYKTQMFQFML